MTGVRACALPNRYAGSAASPYLATPAYQVGRVLLLPLGQRGAEAAAKQAHQPLLGVVPGEGGQGGRSDQTT